MFKPDLNVSVFKGISRFISRGFFLFLINAESKQTPGTVLLSGLHKQTLGTVLLSEFHKHKNQTGEPSLCLHIAMFITKGAECKGKL